MSDKLKEISLENLKYLSGPNNPYFEIIKEFLKHTNFSLSGLYPKSKEMLLTDELNNIHYTYHPNYLNRRGKLLEMSNTLNDYIK